MFVFYLQIEVFWYFHCCFSISNWKFHISNIFKFKISILNWKNIISKLRNQKYKAWAWLTLPLRHNVNVMHLISPRLPASRRPAQPAPGPRSKGLVWLDVRSGPLCRALMPGAGLDTAAPSTLPAGKVPDVPETYGLWCLRKGLNRRAHQHRSVEPYRVLS